MDKYLNFARKLKKLWNMKVMVMPIVIGALDTVTKGDDKRTGGLGKKKTSGDCYKTRSCFDLKKQNERRKEEKKKKNRSYHFEFSTQNEKLVAHASAPRRTSVCDKLTKKNTLINI